MAFGKYAVDYEARIDYDRLRKERLQKAKDQLNQDGLGAIITWEEANIRYLTSYYVTTPMRPAEMQFALLTRNGEPHLFGGGTPSETERIGRKSLTLVRLIKTIDIIDRFHW